MAKIAIIDDQEEVREVLDLFLSKKGFVVIQAKNGREGIDLVRQHKPDLVLLDSKMPDIDGMEVLKKIREFDKGVTVVMLSGSDSEELEVRAREAGASGCLSKALDMEKIVKAVCDMVR